MCGAVQEADGVTGWGGHDREALDKAYNARATVPDFDAVMARYTAESARVRKQLGGKLGLSFGRTPDETLDVFPAEAKGAPINLFIHGGYWRALTKDEHSFVVEALVPAGATMVVNSYALAPAVTLDEIVRQCRAAVAWTYSHAAEFGADPDRLFVSGHSAGGHLAAMMAATDWESTCGIPNDVIKGVTAVSGLFDLRPVRRCFVNEWLGLNDEDALRNSPSFNLPDRGCPLTVADGEHDPEGFRTQAAEFLAAWTGKGYQGRLLEMPGFNHFAVIEQMGRAESALFAAVARQMGLRA